MYIILLFTFVFLTYILHTMFYQALLTIDERKKELVGFATHYFRVDAAIFFDWCEENSYRTLGQVEKLTKKRNKIFRPVKEPFGGILNISFEASRQDELFYHWFYQGNLEHGTIELYNHTDVYMPFKRIEFWDGWISNFSEDFSSTGEKPMIFSCSISAATIRVNKELVVQRNWWITDINAKEEKSDSEEKGNIICKRAYWIDENGKERDDLDVDVPVTLYIVLEGDYDIGQVLSPLIEDKSDDGIKRCKCKGTVNEEKILVIDNFRLEDLDTDQNE